MANIQVIEATKTFRLGINILKRITKDDIRQDNYKGVRGRIGVVGGARDYAGAPYFAAMSAMRLGADLAYVICSEKAGQVIKGYSPDLIVTPLLDCQDETMFESEMDCLLKRLHALVIGPGLGREKLLQARAKRLIELARAHNLPLVLDADSLILVNEDPSIIRSYSKALLTPNRVELKRLLDSLFTPETFDTRNMKLEELKTLTSRCSRELAVSILAKGEIDIITDSQGNQLETDRKYGSKRRCGGQGDILSGTTGVYMHWMSSDSPIDINGSRSVNDIAAWAGYLASITTREANQLAYRKFRGGMLASHMIEELDYSIDCLINDGWHASPASPPKAELPKSWYKASLTNREIDRYRRQMIMPQFGPERQLKLLKSSCIIIGAGGLGCPVAIYLAAGGMGRIGLVDNDRVEESNLHRQILHNIYKIGQLKTKSIAESILAINPKVEVDLHSVRMDRNNAVSLIKNYDMVIDATDNLQTRYMISDACVVAKKPLISGAALGMDGQLTVYNYDKDTPCFRCLFPEPPPSSAVGSCSENGVLGVVPGVIGVQQAMEAIRLAAGLRPAYAGKMLLFDGQLGLTRQVTLSRRRENCPACGPNSILNQHDLVDYESLVPSSTCTQAAAATASSTTTTTTTTGGSSGGSQLLEPSERISLEEYCDILKSNRSHLLIDVRPLDHSMVSRFAHALQIPVNELRQESNLRLIKQELEKKNTKEVFVVCRRGIASQKGVRLLQESLSSSSTLSVGQSTTNGISGGVVVKDLIGGMTGWSERIDPNYSCL